jgi:hypothetical protein
MNGLAGLEPLHERIPHANGLFTVTTRNERRKTFLVRDTSPTRASRDEKSTLASVGKQRKRKEKKQENREVPRGYKGEGKTVEEY